MFKLFDDRRAKEMIELKNEIARLKMQSQENWSLKVRLANALNEISRLGGDTSEFRQGLDVSEPVVSLAEYASDWHVASEQDSSAVVCLSKVTNFDEINSYLASEGVQLSLEQAIG
ncbi:hypothetical protein RyT2_11740 [Pseudolactococcus yaeyamensis]